MGISGAFIFVTLMFNTTCLVSSSVLKGRDSLDSPTDYLNVLEDLINGGKDVVDGVMNLLEDTPASNNPPILKNPTINKGVPASPNVHTPQLKQPLIPDLNRDGSTSGSNSRSRTEPESTSETSPAGIPYFECDTSDNACRESTPYIVFPLGCVKDIRARPAPCDVNAQNDATTAMLSRIVGDRNRIYISNDDNDGVFLWALHMTAQQAREVESAKDKVRAVVADIPIKLDGLRSQQISSTQNPIFNFQKKRLLKVRDEEKVKFQRNAPKHLCMISQIENNPIQNKYNYFESAGRGITIYNIDSGANPLNNFVNIRRWIYGNGVSEKKADYAPNQGHGSCTTSLMLGTYGVSKKSQIVAIKTALMTSDWLDSWQKIVNDIGRREKNMASVRGYNVVSNQILITRYGNEIQIALQKKLKTLFNIHQTVVVTSSGNDGGDIDSLPGILSTNRDFPVITVGGVNEDGATLPESQGGPALTVCAPGIVTCATREPGTSTRTARGTSAASAQVAGHAANLLASQKYGVQLRSQDNIPTAVRDLIVDLAYVREGGSEKVISNGIGISR